MTLIESWVAVRNQWIQNATHLLIHMNSQFYHLSMWKVKQLKVIMLQIDVQFM